MLSLLEQFRWIDALDILIVAFAIYQSLLALRGTRAFQMILGLTSPVHQMMIPEVSLEALPRMTNGLGEEYLCHYLPPDVSRADCLTERAHTGPFHSYGKGRFFDIAAFSELVGLRVV